MEEARSWSLWFSVSPFSVRPFNLISPHQAGQFLQSNSKNVLFPDPLSMDGNHASFLHRNLPHPQLECVYRHDFESTCLNCLFEAFFKVMNRYSTGIR